MNNLAGRITTQGSDPSGLGRWTHVCLEGKTIDTETPNDHAHRQIYTITGYCPPQHDSSNPGDDTACMQQKRLLTMQGVTNPWPRQQWFEDLTKQITEWQSTEADILLCMDANADVMDKDFQKLLTDTGLVDLMANKLGNQLPETYNRGSTTLDHCFGSPRLAKAVKKAGYLAYNDGIPTDHRGMFLDFNRKLLYGAQQHIVKRPARTLSTKNKIGAKQYRQQASTNISSNNILKRALAIEEDAKSGFTNELKIELEK
eukprot:scaffold263990_cov30-Attheya_sp.AAC.1